MHLDIEALANAALIAVLADDDSVLGTGFVVDEHGTVLTCHHVIDGLASVRLRATDGSILEADEEAFSAAPEIDLALIRTSSAFGIPLPVASKALSVTTFWTKGYHGDSKAIRAAIPVQGHSTGTTSVSYRSKKTSYNIDDVLVLRDEPIDPGLSGAPVLDLEAGVVIAVVSTKFVRNSWNGGFAVPIAHAARNAALADAVKENETSIPAFGAYLNAPAAQALCREITDSEIDKLAQLRDVDLSRRVPRAGVTAAFSKFLSERAPILALTGSSGVGKSTEIAALAQQLPGRALLLRGSSLHPDSTGGPGEAIRAALTSLRPSRPLPDDADDAIARALAADGGLVVLIDALNEVPLSGQALEEWILNIGSWLRDVPAQLVISCRSELWDDLIAKPLKSIRESIVVAVGPFTAEEYREAAPVYGLSAEADWPILRLPLALRLCTRYQQNQAQALDAFTSINEVIETYIKEKARNLATSGTGPPLPSQLILDRLTAVARLMREQDTDAVDIRSLGEIFGAAATVDALITENVMSSTPSGYRFVYDDAADWLQSRGLDLDGELTAISHGSWRRVGPIASALREIARRDGPEALNTRLAQLVENPGDARYLAFRIAAVTLTKVADAQPYGDVLDRMAQMIVTQVGYSDLYFVANPEPAEFWRSIPLPLAQRLDLLKRLCLCINYYPWRAKDWAVMWGQWAHDVFISETNYGMLTFNLVRQDPAAGIPQLTSWLGDTRELAGDFESPSERGGSILGHGEARVASVAMCILYQLRTEQESLVWAAMIAGGELCSPLVYQLAEDDPEFLSRMISNEPNVETSDKLVIYAAEAIFTVYERLRTTPPAEITQAVYNAVDSRYSRGLDRQSLGSALNVLIKGPNGQQYIHAVVDAYEANVPGVTEHTLVAAGAQDRGETIVPVAAAALTGGAHSKNDILRALARSPEPRIRDLGDRIVAHYLRNGMGNVDDDVSRYAEARIWRGGLGQNALDIIQRVIDAPTGSGRYVLAYPLTDFEEPGDAEQRLTLLHRFVDASADDESARQTAELLIRRIRENNPLPGAFELLKQVLTRLESSQSDRILIREAFLHSEFADTLAGWLTAGELSPPGEYTRQFKERIEAGASPAAVARELVRRTVGDST